VADPRRGVTSATIGLRTTLLAIVVAFALGGCGGGDGAPDAAVPPRPTGALAGDATLLEGRRVYAKYCASCHGVSGEGAPAPAFVQGRLLRVLPDAADQLALVREGVGAMPSFADTLTTAQLDAVVRYTREVLATRE
jgi:mono/diheme cytochrome c family protein